MTLPILIECPFEKADGFIFRQQKLAAGGRWVPVRILPLAALEKVEKSKAQGGVETQYGQVSQRTRIALLTMNLLVQAIQSGDGNALAKYVQLKAAEEAREEAQWKVIRPSAFAPPGSALPGPLTPVVEQIEFERLEPVLREEVLARVRGPGHPVAELCAELYRRASPHLVLWWRHQERNLAPGLYCSTLGTALFSLLLSRIAVPQGTAICARCQKVFTRSRIAQTFCSTRCGNAVRQARRRAKRKEEPV